jgi:dolichol-phosphate mannosyltransferase
MNERAWRIARYLVSGGTATGVNFVALYALTEYSHLWYLTSSVIAITLGFLTSFVLQKFWTFRNNGLKKAPVQFSLHFLLSLLNLALNTLFLYLLVQYAHLWYMLAQFFISGALACMNYVIYRRIIFPEVLEEHRGQNA